jgi:hypothetical protein
MSFFFYYNLILFTVIPISLIVFYFCIIYNYFLIYVSNISRDLAEIHSFYNNAQVKEKGIEMDSSLYEILVKSLFRHL